MGHKWLINRLFSTTRYRFTCADLPLYFRPRGRPVHFHWFGLPGLRPVLRLRHPQRARGLPGGLGGVWRRRGGGLPARGGFNHTPALAGGARGDTEKIFKLIHNESLRRVALSDSSTYLYPPRPKRNPQSRARVCLQMCFLSLLIDIL